LLKIRKISSELDITKPEVDLRSLYEKVLTEGAVVTSIINAVKITLHQAT
jgi:hypothetical protein